MRHYLQFSDFSAGEYEHLFRRTRAIKERFKNYIAYQPLTDRMLALVFEKSSTRTRVSFEAGMFQLGGASIVLNMGDTQLGRGEPIEDVARVVSRMVDIVMIRTFEQAIIERFAAHSRVPVINGLTNEYHPCQVFADIYTYVEQRGSIRGKTVAWTTWTVVALLDVRGTPAYVGAAVTALIPGTTSNTTPALRNASASSAKSWHSPGSPSTSLTTVPSDPSSRAALIMTVAQSPRLI